jgi:hypothetical protein
VHDESKLKYGPVKEMGDCIIRKRRRGGAGRVINKRRK